MTEINVDLEESKEEKPFFKPKQKPPVGKLKSRRAIPRSVKRRKR